MPFIFSQQGRELVLFTDKEEMVQHFTSVVQEYFDGDKVVFEDGTTGDILFPAEDDSYWHVPESESLEDLLGQLKESLTRTDMNLDGVKSWSELFDQLWRLEKKDHKVGCVIQVVMWVLIITITIVAFRIIA